MPQFNRKQVIQLVLSVSMLGSIKLQDPTVSYLKLLMAAPVTYTVSEKVTAVSKAKKES
ncbi:MAG: hypothetical protein AAFV90_21780 [Cyanobacteria bacterium J06634_5]